LLSVNPSALSAVQGFAFSALATSLIGYAVSFPRQLLDTLELIFTKTKSEKQIHTQCQIFANGDSAGRIGFVTFSGRHNLGNTGRASFDGTRCFAASEVKPPSSTAESNAFHHKFVMMLVLGVPILIGSFFRSTFSRALDFAGVYANCFLFGILPPAMAYVQQSRKKLRYCRQFHVQLFAN
jgi:tyrosine-specific transport protein